MNKYHNRRVLLDGYTFPSQAEAQRYQELKTLEAAGEIRGLEIHPRFTLLVNGVDCGYYEADFGYIPTGEGLCEPVYEDVKGVRTAVYQLKKKLVKALYGIEIQEVQA